MTPEPNHPKELKEQEQEQEQEPKSESEQESEQEQEHESKLNESDSKRQQKDIDINSDMIEDMNNPQYVSNDSLSSFVYNKLRTTIIPPLQSSLTHLYSSPTSPDESVAISRRNSDMGTPGIAPIHTPDTTHIGGSRDSPDGVRKNNFIGDDISSTNSKSDLKQSVQDAPVHNDSQDDEVDMATMVPTDRPQKNIFGLIGSSQLYTEVRNYVQSQRTRFRSNSKDGEPLLRPDTARNDSQISSGSRVSSGVPSFAYGVAESSSEEGEEQDEREDEQDEREEDEREEDEREEDERDEESIHDFDSEYEDLFEDAQDKEDNEEDKQEDNHEDARSEQTLHPSSMSHSSSVSHSHSPKEDISSLISSMGIKGHPTENLTTFQKSIIDNFEINHIDGVLSKFSESDADPFETHKLSTNMKLSIADRLQKVFKLDDGDYFYCNFNAWLVRDVFLQGHIYLTRNCVLFFAFLPQTYTSAQSTSSNEEFKKQDDSSVYIQTGSLTMKTKRYGEILGTVLTNRFWAILRSETLSIYSSPTDLYFPSLVIDLRSCSKVEILEKYQPKTENATKYANQHPNTNQPPHSSGHDTPSVLSPRETEKNPLDEFNDDEELSKMLAIEAEENKETISGGVWFKISTNKKSYKFQTDNLYSARQWVNSITKIIFSLHNANSKNEVLIKIPFDKISQFYRKNLFGVTDHPQENFKQELEDRMPSIFSVNYSSEEPDNDSTAIKMSKKIQEKTKQRSSVDALEWLHFAFFSKGTHFEQLVAKIISQRDAADTESDTTAVPSEPVSSTKGSSKSSLTKVSISGTKKKKQKLDTEVPISTLSRTGNHLAILEQIASVNEDIFNQFSSLASQFKPQRVKTQRSNSDSKLKKLGKTLSTKVFTPTRSKLEFQLSSGNVSTVSMMGLSNSGHHSTTNSGHQSGPNSGNHSGTNSGNVLSPQPTNSFPISPSESSESTSPVNLNLPRQMSLTGLKSLNMTFEASKRDIGIAADRYGDRVNETKFPVSEILPGPLTLADPSEYTNETIPKDTKLKTIGKSIKSLSLVASRWNAHPNHYIKFEPHDPYFVEGTANELGKTRFRSHFSLGNQHDLAATYFCHVQRALPVYGKLYVGDEMVCFRSLLPGVSTRMILPLRDVENCYKQRGTKITYHGLTIVIKGHEKLCVEFSSYKTRDDCLDTVLEMLDHLHSSETWKPMAYEWGPNFDLELGRERLEGSDEEDSFAPSQETLKQASARIETARIKLFEDRITLAAGLQLPIVLEDSPFIKTEIRPNTSYHFVLLTIGSRGDVQPYIALGKGLIAEGHRVTIATHSEFKDWISKHGVGFKEVAGDPAELMSLMVTHGSMSVAFIKEASAKFKGWINDLLRTAWLACQGADILIESPSAMAGVHIAEALGIPYMRAFTMPWTRTRAYSHAFILPDQKKGGSYNYLTHIMFETVFWKGISSQVNKWRVETLNIPRTSLYKLQQYKIPFLYNVSKSVLAPAVDFPDWVKVTGYWFLDEGATKDYTPPSDLVQFLAQASIDQKKIVYIGFGSIVVNDARSLTQAVIDAVLDADVRCILNKGWSDRLQRDQPQKDTVFPPQIFNVESIPHDWLFPRIDAAVHHGGSGTTGASLRSGLPTIVKPFFGDQFFYAARVEEVGAGISLKKLNSKSLSKALHSATTDIKLIERAKRISEEIKNEHGVLSAIEAIYSELEYARSLIVNKQISNEQIRLHSGSRSNTGTFTLNTPQNEEAFELGSYYDYEYDSDSIEIDFASRSSTSLAG